ncbi:MAG: YceI family protein [Ktedonobacteraceae bacterium]|nr:YceI family protein [Ktedonobacteraceae bacterium]
MAWEIDPTHSQASFTVRHMMVATVRGQFKVISGKLHIDEQQPANSWVEAQVDAASIDTRDERRDGHLRSPDFFEAEKYPLITFKSTHVEHAGDEEYNVTGDLTMHGVTKPVTFKAEYAGQAKDLDGYGFHRVGLSAKTKVNRKDFGLNWNQALESGGVLVSDAVTIEIDLSAIQKPA